MCRVAFFVPTLSGELASNPLPQVIEGSSGVVLMRPAIDGQEQSRFTVYALILKQQLTCDIKIVLI